MYTILASPDRRLPTRKADRGKIMRRNLLVAALVASGLAVSVANPLPAAVQVEVPLRLFPWAGARAPASGTAVEAPGGSTVPLGPTWVDPWPGGPCRTAAEGGAR